MILFLAAAAFFSLVGCVCDDPGNADYADVCYKIFGEFENALLSDKGNIHRMRNAFFYAPNADPVLTKVIYNVSYAKNMQHRRASIL